MTCATRPLARRALAGLVAPLALLLAPAAPAAPPAIHGLGGSAAASRLAPARSLSVPGRAPARRFRRGSPARASSRRVTDSAAEGARTNGKILATDPSGSPYSCSGTSLNTPSRSIVITAGHCAVEGGRAGRHISFVPAYEHGRRPFGTFTVRSVYVMPQWRRSQNPDFDLAALRVRPNRLGALTDVVGGRGYTTSKSRFSALQIFGYPAAALRGEELRSCWARGLGRDPLTFRFGGPPTMPSSCDMARGASGGAWIVAGQYVNGVTSYSYVGGPGRLYSPYFGPAIGNFLQRLP